MPRLASPQGAWLGAKLESCDRHVHLAGPRTCLIARGSLDLQACADGCLLPMQQPVTTLSLTVSTPGAGAAKGGSAGRGGVRSSVANFYTDESPGIKFQPVSVHLAALPQQPTSKIDCARQQVFVFWTDTVLCVCVCVQAVVIVMSLGFIAFVTILHIIGRPPCLFRKLSLHL